MAVIRWLLIVIMRVESTLYTYINFYLVYTTNLINFLHQQVLIWDEKLTGPMDQIARYSFLKQRGVERMFRLDQRLGARDVDGVENVVYVTRPDVSAMEAVANSVKGGRATIFFLRLPSYA